MLGQEWAQTQALAFNSCGKSAVDARVKKRIEALTMLSFLSFRALTQNPARSLCAALVLLSVPTAAHAQQREVPYWAAIQADEANMRVGPSTNFPIDWVYRRKGLPMKVVRTNQGWRLVQDPDGTQGWIVGRLLTRERGAIVIGDGVAEIRQEPATGSKVMWTAEPGVVGRLGECQQGWCEFNVTGRMGWISENRIWGEGSP